MTSEMYLLIDSSSINSLVLFDKKIKLVNFGNQNHASHNETLYESVVELVNKDIKSITAIILGVGPGSFTGIRIAQSLAVGLGLALDIPIIAVSSLKIWSWLSFNIDLYPSDESLIFPYTIGVYSDARRGQSFFGSYQLNQQAISVKIKDVLVENNNLNYYLGQNQKYLNLDNLDERFRIIDPKDFSNIYGFNYLVSGETVYLPDSFHQIEINYIREVSATTLKERGK